MARGLRAGRLIPTGKFPMFMTGAVIDPDLLKTPESLNPFH